MWSAVTNRVSVVPVTVIGTRGTVPDDDEADVDEADDDDEVDDDPPEPTEDVDDDEGPVLEDDDGLEQADEKAAPAGPRRAAVQRTRRNERDLSSMKVRLGTLAIESQF
jgi:hypothetical protein